MNMHRRFEIASAAPMERLLDAPPPPDTDMLLVTGLFLGSSINTIKADRSLVYAQPLTEEGEANETLNAVSRWLRDNNALDQRPIHGERRFDYNITFYKAPAGASFLSVVNDFYLEDYIFAHNHPEQAGHVDDLMRMLDRDKLAEAMLKTLKEDFGLMERVDAPLFWRRDMRMASHPDHRYTAAPALAAA